MTSKANASRGGDDGREDDHLPAIFSWYGVNAGLRHAPGAGLGCFVAVVAGWHGIFIDIGTQGMVFKIACMVIDAYGRDTRDFHDLIDGDGYLSMFFGNHAGSDASIDKGGHAFAAAGRYILQITVGHGKDDPGDKQKKGK